MSFIQVNITKKLSKHFHESIEYLPIDRVTKKR